MATFMNDLSRKTGINPDLVEKGFEAILLALRDRIPGNAFETISAIIPEARQLPPDAPTEITDQLGVWGSTLSEMKSRTTPTGQAPLTQVITQLTRSGFSLVDVQHFLPLAFQHMKQNLPPEIFLLVDRGIPGLGNLATAEQTGFLNRLRNLW